MVCDFTRIYDSVFYNGRILLSVKSVQPTSVSSTWAACGYCIVLEGKHTMVVGSDPADVVFMPVVPLKSIKQLMSKNLQDQALRVFLNSELLASFYLFALIYFKVQGHIQDLIQEHFKDDLEQVMRDPILFGDFRMALNEGEPRVYEDIQDYDAAKALFQV